MILIIDGNGLARTLYHMDENHDPPDVVERFLNRLEHLEEYARDIASKANEDLKLAVCFDSRGRNFRRGILPDYKAQRTPDLLAYEAVDHAKEAVEHSDTWICVEAPQDQEADDVIAWIARKEVGRVIIHSADKDFNQCLEDGRVSIIKRSGVEDSASSKITSLAMPVLALTVVNYTYRKFVDDYGFTPDRWVDYQCMVGDSADNVKGAMWVGDKAARKIIGECEQLEGYDPSSLNKRQQECWPDFIERLPVLRKVLTLGAEMEEV